MGIEFQIKTVNHREKEEEGKKGKKSHLTRLVNSAAERLMKSASIRHCLAKSPKCFWISLGNLLNDYFPFRYLSSFQFIVPIHPIQRLETLNGIRNGVTFNF